ncbi:MAG: hypothetical protein WCO69_03670 [Candidatus Omnitrophota bacterium]
MNKKAVYPIILFFLFPFSIVLAADPLVTADESYFLQQEAVKARAQANEKGELVKKMALEAVAAKDELTAVQAERDALQGRVFALQQSLLERDRNEPRKMEQAAAPFRSRMEDLEQQVQVLKLTVGQKSAKADELSNERIALSLELDKISAEKQALRDELRKMADQLQGIKALTDNKASDERNSCQEKIKDLQARLSAEQTLAGEKARQAKKPLEEKNVALTAQANDLKRELEALKRKVK